MRHRLRLKSGRRPLLSERRVLPDGRSAADIRNDPSNLPSCSVRMSETIDWLAELRESKREAIERAQAKIAASQATLQAAEERLKSEQAQVATLVRSLQIEPLLRELAGEILNGHPNFFGLSLTRNVRSRVVGTTLEIAEPPPWSGPVESNPLPATLDLQDGRYIATIDWRLESNYGGTELHELRPLQLSVSTSASRTAWSPCRGSWRARASCPSASG